MSLEDGQGCKCSSVSKWEPSKVRAEQPTQGRSQSSNTCVKRKGWSCVSPQEQGLAARLLAVCSLSGYLRASTVSPAQTLGIIIQPRASASLLTMSPLDIKGNI